MKENENSPLKKQETGNGAYGKSVDRKIAHNFDFNKGIGERMWENKKGNPSDFIFRFSI